MTMYDDLADVYDRFINWPARLARELPLLTAWLGDARTVADTACGTGRHALALARAGYQVTGFDPAGEALAVGRQAAAAAGLTVDFRAAAFGAMAATAAGPFDAVLCLGNSLPHATTPEALAATVADFARLLRPGGRLLAAMRHLAADRAAGRRWLPLRATTDPDDTEWIFQRLYDHLPDDLVAFHFITLRRPPGGDWAQRMTSVTLRAWRPDELQAALADWQDVAISGGLDGRRFDPAGGDLVVTATRPA